MSGFIEFAESRPEQVRRMLGEAPVAYVPFGSLEWHGEHCPLGLDGLKSEELLRRAADITGGVLFPTVFWGAFHTMRFPFSFHFPSFINGAMVGRMLVELRRIGFKVIVMLTGHYPLTQVLHLYLQARIFNLRKGSVALAFPEMLFAWDMGYFGDHAGHWETSIMMHLRPELVDTSALEGPAMLPRRLFRWGVIGRDPSVFSDQSLGEEVVECVVEGLSGLVEVTLGEGSAEHYMVLWRDYLRNGALRPRALLSQLGI